MSLILRMDYVPGNIIHEEDTQHLGDGEDDDFLDDRPEIPILPLEPVFIGGEETVEMMGKHPVKNRPLRMSRTIDSRHGGRNASGNGPTSPRRPDLSWKDLTTPGADGEI
jgi:hypothetical protein